uniref:FAD-binding protein n=1 Tax=Muribaculaceae bacterium Z82 TaxID=2304548 RepID=A0A7C9N8V6_9BACT
MAKSSSRPWMPSLRYTWRMWDFAVPLAITSLRATSLADPLCSSTSSTSVSRSPRLWAEAIRLNCLCRDAAASLSRSSPSASKRLLVEKAPLGMEGGDELHVLTVSDSVCNSALWKVYRNNVLSMSDSIDVWYNSPASSLFRDPVSKAVIGVEVDRNGDVVNVRAKNGVVMTMGGFENTRRWWRTSWA